MVAHLDVDVIRDFLDSIFKLSNLRVKGLLRDFALCLLVLSALHDCFDQCLVAESLLF